MTVAFDVRVNERTGMRELQLRISETANGWMIKAGGPPMHFPSKASLLEAIGNVIERFVATKP